MVVYDITNCHLYHAFLSTFSFSIVSQNFSDISSLIKKYDDGQKYMGKTKIRDVIAYHLPLRNSPG